MVWKNNEREDFPVVLHLIHLAGGNNMLQQFFQRYRCQADGRIAEAIVDHQQVVIEKTTGREDHIRNKQAKPLVLRLRLHNEVAGTV